MNRKVWKLPAGQIQFRCHRRSCTWRCWSRCPRCLGWAGRCGRSENGMWEETLLRRWSPHSRWRHRHSIHSPGLRMKMTQGRKGWKIQLVSGHLLRIDVERYWIFVKSFITGLYMSHLVRMSSCPAGSPTPLPSSWPTATATAIATTASLAITVLLT